MKSTTELSSGSPSQRDRVERDLRDAGASGVCSSHWYQSAVPNNRNTIAALRALSWHIESPVCSDPHETSYRRYTLIHDASRRCATCPGAPQQMKLAEARS